jgi:hypothetical protein
MKNFSSSYLCSSFTCLHSNGRLRNLRSTAFTPLSPTDIYYPQDLEDLWHRIKVFMNDNCLKWQDINNDNCVDIVENFNDKHFYSTKSFDNRYCLLSLGLGDFIAFNLMVLMSLSPCWSMTKKIFVVFGSIISIQLGQWSMRVSHHLFAETRLPALPFSVIPFSIYTVIVNSVMEYMNFD